MRTGAFKRSQTLALVVQKYMVMAAGTAYLGFRLGFRIL